MTSPCKDCLSRRQGYPDQFSKFLLGKASFFSCFFYEKFHDSLLG